MILQVAKELELREIELNKTKEEKKKLAEKLKMLQGKLIVGGVDLVRRSLIITNFRLFILKITQLVYLLYFLSAHLCRPMSAHLICTLAVF